MIYYKQMRKGNSETLIFLSKLQLFAYNIMSILLILEFDDYPLSLSQYHSTPISFVYKYDHKTLSLPTNTTGCLRN